MWVCVCVCVLVWITYRCLNPIAWIQHPSPWTSDKKITTFHFTASRPLPLSLSLSLILSHPALHSFSPPFLTSLSHPQRSLCLSTWLAILSHVPEDGRLCGSLAGCQGSAGEQGTCSDWNGGGGGAGEGFWVVGGWGHWVLDAWLLTSLWHWKNWLDLVMLDKRCKRTRVLQRRDKHTNTNSSSVSIYNKCHWCTQQEITRLQSTCHPVPISSTISAWHVTFYWPVMATTVLSKNTISNDAIYAVLLMYGMKELKGRT